MNEHAHAPLDRGNFASAAEYAYAALRREIVEGRFSAGRRMREVELSEWLGMSRTPVRQALSRLELEGLLVVQPRIGLVVASLDPHATAELYVIRAALEGTAAWLAARHASQIEIDDLKRLVVEEVTLPDEPAVLYRHNLVFHRAIYAAAHNRFLVKSLAALHDSMALLGPTTLSTPGRRKTAEREHALIVEAIARRDSEAAETAARAHIREAYAARRRLSDSG